MIRVLVVDDHELLRRGLKSILLESFPEVVIGEAADAREALTSILGNPWDVVLLDINMPGRDGLDLLVELRAQRPALPVLVLTAFAENEFALRAFKNGAAGYLSKQGASSELILALRKVLAGGRYVTPSLAERLAAVVSGLAPVDAHETLSARELQVLRLIARGRTLKEIAAELCLSERTIGTYRTRISQKMNLGSNVELTRYAVLHGLVD